MNQQMQDQHLDHQDSDPEGRQDDTQVDSQEVDLEKKQQEAETLPPARKTDFPDGGLEAWSVVLGASLVLFCSLGNVNAYGVLQAYYQTHQLKEVKASVVALIGSFQLFILYSIAPFIGVAFDKYGPRYLMASGTVIMVFGLMMQSLCTEYYQFFLAQAVVVGLGASLVFWPALSAVNHWFLKKRAFALGLAVGGSSIGGVVLPILYNKLFDKVGFGWTVRIAAFLTLGLLLIANVLVKSRLPPSTTSQAILDPDGFKDPRYSLVFCATFCIIMGIFVPFFYIQPYGQQLGVDENLAFYLVSILNGASFFGRVLPGLLADKFGRFNFITICVFIAGILVLAYWLSAKTSGAIVGFAATYGFFSGSYISLNSAVVAQISPIEKIGARLGMMYGPMAIATLVGTPIAGALYGNFGGYGPAIIFAGVAILVGSCFMLAARIVYTRDPLARV